MGQIWLTIAFYSMPNMSDTARKRTLADWVVKTKKQVVKLYAVAKWSRDAHTIQKCMVRPLIFTACYFPDAEFIIEYNSISYDTKSTVRGDHERSQLCKRISRPSKVFVSS